MPNSDAYGQVWHLDVNGDGAVTPLDVLAIFNAVNDQFVDAGEGESDAVAASGAWVVALTAGTADRAEPVDERDGNGPGVTDPDASDEAILEYLLTEDTAASRDFDVSRARTEESPVAELLDDGLLAVLAGGT